MSFPFLDFKHSWLPYILSRFLGHHFLGENHIFSVFLESAVGASSFFFLTRTGLFLNRPKSVGHSLLLFFKVPFVFFKETKLSFQNNG